MHRGALSDAAVLLAAWQTAELISRVMLSDSVKGGMGGGLGGGGQTT